jgi:uncharacterized protein YjbI with pentapeptide repeats
MMDDPSTLLEYISGDRTARDLVLLGSDLRGVALSGLRADSVDIRETDLRESSLTGVRWTNCTLRDARLESADFSDAVLRICDLSDARAANAVFTRARLENSTARGARFDAADFSHANLTDTDFSRASFRAGNLRNVRASGVDLRGADLTEAILAGADLTDADLRGADLTNADLTGAELHGADLRGAIGYTTDALRDLSGTVAPIVGEVLRTAGQRGVIDMSVAAKVMEDVGAGSPRNALSPEALKAVTAAVSGAADLLPRLVTALQQPRGSEPPPEVAALIQRVSQALGLEPSATAEEVLDRLVQRLETPGADAPAPGCDEPRA